MKVVVELKINGDHYHVAVSPQRTLLDILRDELGLTGTKKGCGEGECGACTVLMDGKPVNSCLVLAVQAQGKEITSIEGLGAEKINPVQEAFVSKGAIQCGYCSPGFIMTALAFLQKNPNPTEDQIKAAISGNLCRCTGYQKIVEAVKDAAGRLQGGVQGA